MWFARVLRRCGPWILQKAKGCVGSDDRFQGVMMTVTMISKKADELCDEGEQKMTKVMMKMTTL